MEKKAIMENVSWIDQVCEMKKNIFCAILIIFFFVWT